MPVGTQALDTTLVVVPPAPAVHLPITAVVLARFAAAVASPFTWSVFAVTLAVTLPTAPVTLPTAPVTLPTAPVTLPTEPVRLPVMLPVIEVMLVGLATVPGNVAAKNPVGCVYDAIREETVASIFDMPNEVPAVGSQAVVTMF